MNKKILFALVFAATASSAYAMEDTDFDNETDQATEKTYAQSENELYDGASDVFYSISYHTHKQYEEITQNPKLMKIFGAGAISGLAARSIYKRVPVITAFGLGAAAVYTADRMNKDS